jgi:hypothetical protein
LKISQRPANIKLQTEQMTLNSLIFKTGTLKGIMLRFSVNLIGLLSVFPVSAQNDSTRTKGEKHQDQKEDLSLFGSDEILNVTLYLDLESFTKKPSKTDTFDSEITIHLNETDSVNRKIIIKYRGLSRYEICSFPPMQINFKKPVYSDSTKIKKLKLVTHCQSSSINNEYVLREYLVYRLYNVLTDTSFKVRLLKVSYIDSKRKKKPVIKYGIFIEPVDMVAKRTGSTVVKSGALNQNHIVPYVMDRVAIFNYMVTNWDWSIPGQHNVEVIKPVDLNPDGPGIAIPYDFDLTGVVNADYAIPPPDLGIENVREPIFYGICRTREVYTYDLKTFLAEKEKLYAVVNDFPHLNQRSKRDITNFLDQFFNQLVKPRNLDNLVEIFLQSCKK